MNEYIPLVSISLKHVLKKRQEYMYCNTNNINKDYVICSGCESISFIKQFCGRIISTPPIYIYYCDKCINKYLNKYLKNIKLRNNVDISPITIL